MPAARSPNSRIHVLEVIGNAIVGGVESHVQRLVERLPRERFSVSAVCPFESRFTDTLRALGCELVIAPMPEDVSWVSMQLVSAFVQARGVDVLHAHLPNAHILAGMAGKLTGRPVLATVHGRQINMPDLEVHHAADTQLCVVTQHTWLHALGLGLSPSRVHLVPNGVDTEVFRPRPRDGALRRELGIGEAVPLVGFVGRLSSEKGPDTFLRMVTQLRTLAPQAHAVIVGDGPMRPSLERFATQFDLKDPLLFAGMRSDMPSVYPEFDVVVSSSLSEAMPFAIMEAMACGVPVVATKVGGVPDLIQQGTSGYLVGYADFQGLAGQTALLLGDATARAAMGERARERMVERFAIADCVSATAELLARLSPLRAGDARRITAVPDGAAAA